MQRRACRENRNLVAPKSSLSRGESSLLRAEQWLTKRCARLVVVILKFVARILELRWIKEHACRIEPVHCRVELAHCRAEKDTRHTFTSAYRRFEMRIATNHVRIEAGDKLRGGATRVMRQGGGEGAAAGKAFMNDGQPFCNNHATTCVCLSLVELDLEVKSSE